ncbi:MAG: hypothetical protein ABJB40_07505 [Acidobacteriota bacterium]
MSKFDSPLTNIKIASPCQANWNEMFGDNRKRFCGDCKLNVYNLSGMTKDEAETLIMNAEGRLCVRFYKRADGSVITQDCPVGWAKLKQRTRVYATAAFSLLMALLTGVLFVSLFSKEKTTMGELKVPFATPTPVPTNITTMGAIAVRPETNSNTSYKPEPGTVMGNFVTPVKKQKPIETKGEIRIDEKNI